MKCILKYDIQMKTIEHHLPVVSFLFSGKCSLNLKFFSILFCVSLNNQILSASHF